MATDPRAFFVKPCAGKRQDELTQYRKKHEFLEAIKKVGQVEVLNDIGKLGKVREGLRVLARVSDSVRVGHSILPKSTEVGNNGANYVLDTVGIPPNAVESVKQFNPAVANRAVGQAKFIYDKIKRGEFEPNDIPETFSDLQHLSDLLEKIYTPQQSLEMNGDGYCAASPYAMDLISYAPKFKFLFVVQFEFADGYTELNSLEAAFVVKYSTRPNVSVEYDEVNMYNYWTRVPKRITHDPITMRFYDDNYNRAMILYNSCLKAMSPIANMEFNQKMEDSGFMEQAAMDFSQLNQNQMHPGPIPTHNYASSYGPKNNPNGRDNIIKRITLFHVYREGKLMNVYRFYNPRIISMELDELDMTQTGDGTEVTFQFAFDSMNILTGYNTNPDADHGDAPQYNLEALTTAPGAKYPLKVRREETDPIQTTTDKNMPPSGFIGQVSEVGDKITEGLSNGIKAVTGAVSNAFTKGADFAGSFFTNDNT